MVSGGAGEPGLPAHPTRPRASRRSISHAAGDHFRFVRSDDFGVRNRMTRRSEGRAHRRVIGLQSPVNPASIERWQAVAMLDDFDADAEFTYVDDWPMPTSARTPDPPVTRSVHGAYHLLMRRLSASVGEHGLDPSEALILAWLLRNPGCAPTVTRQALGFHRSTLSSILNRLERDGLLSREPRPFGGRRFELNLTRGGTVMAGLAEAVIRDVEADLRQYTTKAERRGAEAVFAACAAIAPTEAALDI